MLLDFPPSDEPYENLDNEIKKEKLKLLRNMNAYFDDLKGAENTKNQKDEVDIHNMKPDDWLLL